MARRRPYWLRSRYWLRRFHLIAPVDATRFGWSDNVQFPRIGTLPDGGSLKPSASTDTRERGTPTPETGTTAGCSSHLEHGSLFMDGYVPTWRPRVNSFTAPGSYGAGTVSLGESGGQRGAVT